MVADGLTLRVQSGLPFAGNNAIEVGGQGSVEKTLSFRVPAWAGKFALAINGEAVSPSVQSGYAEVRRVWNSGDRVELNFDLAVSKKFSRYEVDANRGRLALTRGPLVYCLEQVDNGAKLDAVTIASNATFSPEDRPDLLGGITVLTGPAVREDSRADLYADQAPARQPITATAVPYYAWNNRGLGEMLVWVRRAAA